ncbi:hypothetical protein QAD02_014741 [Eretmocerus hayati]|uniref:Uncharacterized protein n=1 Tax=Eretmocerus hayati TaxID=131215 RepID=A0ACC2P5S5_9HYME|nr:hypothetical protein QAD02_014741 [Eretmocerus hayati]
MGKRRRRDDSTSSSESSSSDEPSRKRRKHKKHHKHRKSSRRHKKRRDRHSSTSSSSSYSSGSVSYTSSSPRSSRSASRSPSKSRYSSPAKKTDASDSTSTKPANGEKNDNVGTSDNEEFALSEDLLNAMGNRFHEDRKLAPPLHSEFMKRWQDALSHGIPDTERAALVKKYHMPENCTFSDPPSVDKELKTAVKGLIHRDARIIAKQEKINACLAVASYVVTQSFKDKKESENKTLLVCMTDLIQLLADLQRDEIISRRNLVMSNLAPAAKEILADTKWGATLFGGNLDELVKSRKTFENSAKIFQGTPRHNQNNFKGPKNSKNPPARRAKDQPSTGGQGRKPYYRKNYRSSPQRKRSQERRRNSRR